MRLAFVALSAACFLASPAIAAAAQCTTQEWIDLGSTSVDLAQAGGTVDFSGNDEPFGAIRFDVEGSPVVIFGLRVDLATGDAYAPTRELVFGGADWSREVKIPGREEKAIDAIAFNYRGGAPAASNVSPGRATIRILGRQTIVLTGGC